MRGSNVKQEAIDFYQALGVELRQQRIICGLSQKQIGDAVGVTFQQWQKYERGTNQISLYLLMKAARELRVPVTHFIYPETTAIEPDASVATQRMRGALLKHFLTIKRPHVIKCVFEMVKVIAENEP